MQWRSSVETHRDSVNSTARKAGCIDVGTLNNGSGTEDDALCNSGGTRRHKLSTYRGTAND